MQFLEGITKWRDIVHERVEKQRVVEARNYEISVDPAFPIRQERARDAPLGEFRNVLRHETIHKVDPILACDDQCRAFRTIDERDTRSNGRVLKLDFRVLRDDFARRRTRRICRPKRKILDLDFAPRNHHALRGAA